MTRTPFEDELVDRLSRLAERAPDVPTSMPDDLQHVHGAHTGRGRRLGPLAGTVAAAVVAIVAGIWLLDRGGSTDVVATAEAPTQATDAPSDALRWPRIGNGWVPIAAGPADGRTFAVEVWTGTELVIWGGEAESETSWVDDGAAYSPVTETWSPIADSPLSARNEHLAVWTGSEVVLCCGHGPTDDSPAAAAYNPTTDTWRQLAPPPFNASLGVAAWTGTEMIVAGGVELNGAWAYSIATDEWRELAAPPATIERSADVAWTGTQLIVWPGVLGTSDGLTYDPAGDTWDSLPPLPGDLDVWGGSMVWTGDEVIVWGNSRTDGTDAVGARISLDGDDWRPIAEDPVQRFDFWNGVPGSNSAVWTGTEMLVWAGAMGEDDGMTTTLAYDPANDSWRDVGTVATTWFGPDLLWTGDVALAMTSPIVAIRPEPEAEPGSESDSDSDSDDVTNLSTGQDPPATGESAVARFAFVEEDGLTVSEVIDRDGGVVTIVVVAEDLPDVTLQIHVVPGQYAEPPADFDPEPVEVRGRTGTMTRPAEGSLSLLWQEHDELAIEVSAMPTREVSADYLIDVASHLVEVSEADWLAFREEHQ